MIKRMLIITLIVGLPVIGLSQTLGELLSIKDTVGALKMIKGGTDVNAVDANGTSQLMNACRWADDTTVSFLVRHGATLDKPKSPKGRTPLMIGCAYYSGKGMCKMLIDWGANVNAVAADNITALMLAAQNAKLDVVELLLKMGANANAKDASGKTAFDYASKAEVSEYLLKAVKDTRIDKTAVMDMLKKAMK